MKKNKKKTFVRITAVVLALLMVVPMIISAFATVAYGAEIIYRDESGKKYTLSDFRDTQGHWAQTQIKAWANYNIINGYNGNFMPNDAIKRCDIACIIDRIMGLKYTSYNSFRDLQDGEYYTDSLLKCYAAGYIQGDGSLLRPLDTATREEVATILYRVFNLEVLDGSSKASFNDMSSISSWASEEVSLMASKGYIKGYPDGSFGPQNPITRAELVTLLDNIVAVYITSAIKSGDVVTNQWDGNVVVNKKGMTFSRSSVSDNLFCTQSCTSLTLQDTEVSGVLYCLSDKMTLKLINSPVSTIYTDAVGIFKGMSNVDTLIVSYEGSGTEIDEMPSTLVLEAGASIKIGKAIYVNDSNKSKTYNSEEIYADIAKDGYTLDKSPTIKVSDIKITADNIVSFEGLKPGQMADGELKSFGILSMEGTNVPTLDDYDDKISYRASYLDEYYRENGGSRGSISDEIGKQDDGETYTYVPYAINYGGMIAYGQPVIIKSYDFEYSMTLLDTGEYPQKVKVVMTFEGENIPKIASVTCYYDTTPAYVAERRERSMSVLRITDSDTRFQEDIEGERVLYSSTISAYQVKGITEPQMPTYFGYKIKFADGSVYSEFPFLLNAIPDSLSPISSITTGSTSTNGDSVTIKNNVIETLNTVVNQYGVVYCYSNTDSVSDDFFDDSWYFMSEGSSISLNSKKDYSVTLKRDGDKNIHYAAYVRTVEGYYFGDIKVYKPSESGTATFSTSINAANIPDGNTLISVSTSSFNIDVLNSRILEVYDIEGNIISGYNNESFSEYLVHKSSNSTNGTRVFLSLPNVTNMGSIKVQCHDGDDFADAYTKIFDEGIVDYVPYVVFSNESMGKYEYSVVLADLYKDMFDDFSIDFIDSDISFNKKDMVITTSTPISDSGMNIIFTLTLNILNNSKFSQSYSMSLKSE